MDILRSKRSSYIQDSIGQEERFLHVANTLLAHKIISNEELKGILREHTLGAKVCRMVDIVRRKGDPGCFVLMGTWEGFYHQQQQQQQRSHFEPSKSMDRQEILELLNQLSPSDIESLKFYTSEMKFQGFHPIGACELNRARERSSLARAIAKHYGDSARRALDVLLMKINRCDLVGVGTEPSSGGPQVFIRYSQALNINRAAVMNKSLELLSRLSGEDLRMFIWRMDLPPSTKENITSPLDLLKVIRAHVRSDILHYVELVHNTLCACNNNSIAEELRRFIFRLAPWI